MYTNEELWNFVKNGSTTVDIEVLYGDAKHLENYSTKDFYVDVDVQYNTGYACTEIARVKGRTRAAKEMIKAIKLEELKSLGYDVRTSYEALCTPYAFEPWVANAVQKINSGNTIFCPRMNKRWKTISNKDFERWFEIVTGEKAPELTGPRWWAVYNLVEVGPVEVDEGTFRRWSTK